ncbi:MAG TPA: hypothetical protein VEL76_19130 [Gemmataceae bacterium]|nr:hypothetical protein [Gemmataceae bacterium]
MSSQLVGLRSIVVCLPLALILSVQGTARSQECGLGGCGISGCPSCGQPCQHHHCPPPYHHCMEGPPRICIKCGCPRPVCNPCDLPHWGYFQPCWRPWPFPPDWSHCPYPTPAAEVAPAPHGWTVQPAPTLPDAGNPPVPRRLGVQPGL